MSHVSDLLLTGCRHLEIDCWDGTANKPVVTHGHTFCTVVHFDAVAKAVAECAFVTSKLPIILSLEMHCSPGQQKKLASLMLTHLGVPLSLSQEDALLTYQELEQTGRASLLSPWDLRGRVLVKGKVLKIKTGDGMPHAPQRVYTAGVAPTSHVITPLRVHDRR